MFTLHLTAAFVIPDPGAVMIFRMESIVFSARCGENSPQVSHVKAKKGTVFLDFFFTSTVLLHICRLDTMCLSLFVSAGCHFNSLPQMKSF